jgi:hypothetical protein
MGSIDVETIFRNLVACVEPFHSQLEQAEQLNAWVRQHGAMIVSLSADRDRVVEQGEQLLDALRNEYQARQRLTAEVATEATNEDADRAAKIAGDAEGGDPDGPQLELLFALIANRERELEQVALRACKLEDEIANLYDEVRSRTDGYREPRVGLEKLRAGVSDLLGQCKQIVPGANVTEEAARAGAQFSGNQAGVVRRAIALKGDLEVLANRIALALRATRPNDNFGMFLEDIRSEIDELETQSRSRRPASTDDELASFNARISRLKDRAELGEVDADPDICQRLTRLQVSYQVEQQSRALERRLAECRNQTPEELQDKNTIAKIKTSLRSVEAMRSRTLEEESFTSAQPIIKRLHELYSGYWELYKSATKHDPEDGWWP